MLQFPTVEVRKTEGFEKWIRSLRDVQSRARILTRLVRLADGHTGDAKRVGGGVWELRIHVGPGWRVYFVRIGERIVLLLAGGEKSTQAKDIARAKAIVKSLEIRDDDEN